MVPGYTRGRRPVELVYAEYYEKLIVGFARERQIKGLSRAKSGAAGGVGAICGDTGLRPLEIGCGCRLQCDSRRTSW